jgi:Ca2+-binding EF-hand superfamily protein
VQEIEAYFYRKPDLVLKCKVGTLDTGFMGLVAKTGLFGKTQRAEIVNQAKLPEPLSKKVKKVDAENLSLELGDARITVQAMEGNSANRLQGVKQFYLQQFDALADKDGFVERGKDNDGNRFIMNLFTQADKNADGKLHRKEFVEWLDLVESGSSAFVSLTVTDSGRNLFNLLDVNGDGKLSIREMRAAWTRMEPLCKAGEGLAQGDLPRTLQVTMGQGFTSGRSQFDFFGQGNRAPKRVAISGVPAWFTKMDRNADGDVSRKEWLGTEEAFNEIDTDGDGLISAAEARAFEAKKPKK